MRLKVLHSILALTLSACTPATDVEFFVNVLPTPASSDSGEPHLSVSDQGHPVLSWLEHDRSITRLRFSELVSGSWQPAQTIAEGAGWFVNWADFPSVVPISQDLWAAHWLELKPGKVFAYDIAMVVSQDAGKTWGQPMRPHDDGTQTEHGFVSLFPWQSGVGTLWLDGRNMVEKATTRTSSTGMTLRSAVLLPDASVIEPKLVDQLVCDCCQTDVAMTKDGPVLAYRNRTQDEIRDIYVVRSQDNQWQTPFSVADDGWQISACPVNGPTIVANGPRVAVSWYTAAGKQPKIQLAWSNDGAITFGEPIKIDVGAVVGRVSLSLADNASAIVGWLRRGSDGEGEICVRRVSYDGTMGRIQVVARTTLARPSGFPQIALAGDKLVIAHTDISAEFPRVVTKWVDIAAL